MDSSPKDIRFALGSHHHAGNICKQTLMCQVRSGPRRLGRSGPSDTDLGLGSSIDQLEGGARNVLFTVWFLQNCSQLVFFLVLFERGASAGADLVGSFDSRHRVELWVVVHDRLVEIGRAFAKTPCPDQI
jgi:hypothetical protein